MNTILGRSFLIGIPVPGSTKNGNVRSNVRQNVSLCLTCDSRPSTSIAQSMQAIVLSRHFNQDRVHSKSVPYLDSLRRKTNPRAKSSGGWRKTKKSQAQTVLTYYENEDPALAKRIAHFFNESFPAEKAYRLLESILATKYSGHELLFQGTERYRTRSLLFCHAILTINRSTVVGCQGFSSSSIQNLEF